MKRVIWGLPTSVIKFGGTSVGSIDRMQEVAIRLKSKIRTEDFELQLW